MKPIPKKETIQKILNIGVEIRAGDLKLLKKYVVKEEGEEGWEKIKKEMKKMGHPITSKDFSVQFSSLGIRILLFLSAKRALGWDDEKLEDWGRALPKDLMIIKFFSPVFRLNREFLFKKLPRIAQRYVKNLEIRPVEADLQNNQCVIRVDKLKSVPSEAEEVGLAYYKGFFAGWAEMVVGEKVACQLEKGKNYYRFTLSW